MTESESIKRNQLQFRSRILCPNADWYEAFEFSYGKSITDVAHVDQQRGGCRTVMLYFTGKLGELPLTCKHVDPLSEMLSHYSIDR